MAAAQSVVRALKLLKMIMSVPDNGIRFTDLVKRSGMDKSNVHRVIEALEQEALIYRNPHTAAYHPLVSDNHESRVDSIRMQCRAAVEALASNTGDTVLLMSRDGDNAVCLDRLSGDYPVKALTTAIGQVRLLGIGSGGLSILASLPDSDIAAFLDRHGRALSVSGIEESDIWNGVQQCRLNGYAMVGDRITPGTRSIGMHIQGVGFNAALCVVSVNERISGDRISWIVTQIQKASSMLGLAGVLRDA